jgi:hypothetical protein
MQAYMRQKPQQGTRKYWTTFFFYNDQNICLVVGF